MNAKDFILQVHKPTLFKFLKPGDQFHFDDGTDGTKVDEMTWIMNGIKQQANEDYLCYPTDWEATAIRSFRRSRHYDDPRFKHESMNTEGQKLADVLLEVSEMPHNPLMAQTHRQWKSKERWGAASVPLAFRKTKEFERGMDASARGMEGEPDKTQHAIERERQWPSKPQQPMYRNSATMARNRNLRRKSFGYSDYRYSMRDLKWPTDPAYRRKFKEPIPEPPQI